MGSRFRRKLLEKSQGVMCKLGENQAVGGPVGWPHVASHSFSMCLSECQFRCALFINIQTPLGINLMFH